MVTYQPHNKLYPSHSLPTDSNKADAPRATMSKRLTHKYTLYLKKHTNEHPHTQVVNEANAQDSPDWLRMESDVSS